MHSRWWPTSSIQSGLPELAHGSPELVKQALLAFKLLIDLVRPFISPKYVADVAFKLFIDNIELVDNEFKLWNIVVDLFLKLLIDNIDLVDNEFKLLNIVPLVAFRLFKYK